MPFIDRFKGMREIIEGSPARLAKRSRTIGKIRSGISNIQNKGLKKILLVCFDEAQNDVLYWNENLRTFWMQRLKTLRKGRSQCQCEKRSTRLAVLIVILASVSFLGCASVPQESVQLSVTLGRDLHEVQRAHRELVVKYFGRMKADINHFVDNTYRPYMIKTSMRDFQLLDRLGRSNASSEGPDALEIMELYVNLLTEQIENYRRELLQNIENQETEALMALDEAYQKLQNANAIVTGHLASIKKVEDAQAELLERAGLENYRKEFVDKIVLVSDALAKLTAEAQKADKKINVEKLAAEIKTVVDKFQ